MSIIIKYRAVNIKGERIKGKCQVEELNDIKNNLRQRGYFICSLWDRTDYKYVFCKRANTADMSLICSELSILLKAGVSVAKALKTLEFQCNKIPLKRALKSIQEDVTKGESVNKSMSKFKDIFPEFMIQMIRVGEESGRLEEVLENLSEYYEKQNKISSSIKSALIYPFITLITAIFVIVFLMIKIVPQFIEIIESSGGEVPVLTKTVLYSCNFFREYYFEVTMILILICLIFYKFCKSLRGERFIENLKMKVPYFSKVYDRVFLMRLSSSMSILIRSGVNIVKSLEITSKVLGSKMLEEKINNSIKDIQRGESVYNSLENSKIKNNLFLTLVKTGEESGNLDLMFIKLEKIFGDELEKSLKKIVSIIEPAIIIFLSLLIGMFILSALMPVFSIMDSIA